MEKRKVIIALVGNSIKEKVKNLISHKLNLDNYELYCVGSEYHPFETLRFEPDYILSEESIFYSVKNNIMKRF